MQDPAAWLQNKIKKKRNIKAGWNRHVTDSNIVLYFNLRTCLPHHLFIIPFGQHFSQALFLFVVFFRLNVRGSFPFD